MARRWPSWAVPALVASLLVNVLLVGLLSLLSVERPLREDITEPVGVRLIRLSPPEAAEPELVREPEEPKPPQQLDFIPDLSPLQRPRAGALDLGVTIDLGRFETPDLTGDFIFNATDLDQPPQPAVRIPPVYPFRASSRGIEGAVRIKLLISSEGTVQQVEILDAEPPGYFEEAVLKAVPLWKFTPGVIDGQPVAAWTVTSVRFDLN
jgi:protein TonB